MTPLLENASIALISGMLAAALRALVLAAVAGAGLVAFRTRSIPLRLFVWTGVLYAALLLPLLAVLLPPLRLPALELVQSAGTVAPHILRSGEIAHAWSPADVPAAKIAARASNSPVTPDGTHEVSPAKMQSSLPSFSWSVLVSATYVAITLIFLVRFVVGLVLSRGLLRSSSTISDGLRVSKLIGESFSRSLSGTGRVAVSSVISVPVTVGVLRPTVLLPPNWSEWDDRKLHAVLAHEFSHVLRRDPLTQTVALLYRAIFWFNPLAWWLVRHLAALAEQASDEAALSGGADRTQYACTLLSFFEALQANPGRIWWQGVSMARTGQAERRLERILDWKGSVTMNLKRPLAIAIVVLAVPIIYLTASVRASAPASAKVTASPQQEAPSAPTVAPAGVTAPAPSAGINANGPISGVPAVALAEPASALYGQNHPSSTDHGNAFSYSYGFDEDGERFVIVSGKSDRFTMSGSGQDARHAEKLKKQIPGDFIWFQRDEKSYIIRDQATIDRARALWAPQEELGKKQEELGKQQEALGKQQEELGKKMEQVRINVPDMTAELDRLKAKLQKMGPNATMDQVGELQSEIGELQSKMGELQSAAGEQQGKLGELQGQLGEKQGKLGEQQGELGRQQAELAEKATREMKGLLDEAIKNGTAKPEEDIVKSPNL